MPTIRIFGKAADYWAAEEVQHGDALGRWAECADPAWDYRAAFARYRAGYHLPLDAEASVRGSRTGELIARCMVETGTSSYYTALGDAAEEPVLRDICRLIAADEFRHYKLFYDRWMRRYLSRERIGMLRRLRIAAGRVRRKARTTRLAYAWHCGNEFWPIRAVPSTTVAAPATCPARWRSTSVPPHRARHEHGLQGGRPEASRGRLSDLSAKGAWHLLQWRRRRLMARLAA